jgi:hypothetical protein
MGDWRQPRRGLTPNERGLPLHWFEKAARSQKQRIVRRRLCLFAPLSRVLSRFGVARPLAHRPVILLDWLLSELFRWNISYRREGWVKKLAPSSALWLIEKPP